MGHHNIYIPVPTNVNVMKDILESSGIRQNNRSHMHIILNFALNVEQEAAQSNLCIRIAFYLHVAEVSICKSYQRY
jgi:hypothetical protein